VFRRLAAKAGCAGGAGDPRRSLSVWKETRRCC